MDKSIKIFSIVSIISGFVAFSLFILVLIDSGYSIVYAFNITWVFFLIHCVSVLYLSVLIRISKYPLKDAYAEVINLEKRFIARHFEFLVTFKLPNNLLWTFDVPLEIFNRMEIGQYGKLTYREKNSKAYFVFFTETDQGKTEESNTRDGSMS